ncbi:cysteine and tyrosine-rich protein 1-like [Mytilus trossulus]|uniref:cysteine and tyrosine-rich protein 1-like n=1 Tax=Mytilus trossulus TaxID=6551 RepID=UPI0030048776
MYNLRSAYKFLVWIILILYFIDTALARGFRSGFRSYRGYISYRSYSYTYYYNYYSYYSSSLSTGAIVGVVFGALIGGAVFLTGCIMCCAFCCCSGNKTSGGQVVRTNQATIATISTNQMSSNATFDEPGVQFTPSQYSSPNQYNTEYSAPPPAYNEVVSTGNVNLGFKKDT